MSDRERELEATAARLRAQVSELEARVRSMHETARMSAETAEAVCDRLTRWEPIVTAASRLVCALLTDNAQLGAAASEELVDAVTQLEKGPSA